MEESLKSKFETEDFSYTDAETEWLIENIGHEQGDVRDSLVYISLSRGISENAFTLAQFDYLKEQTINRNLLFYKLDEAVPASLTRTFSALLNTCLVGASSMTESKYHQRLNKVEETYFFDAAINYLQEETDFTGYSEVHGWVHGIAHGADFLGAVLCHQSFPKERNQEVLGTILGTIKRMNQPFIEGEERRLATVIYRGILEGKLTQKEVASWINQTDFPLVDHKDFYQLAMFENLLAGIYFHLKGKVILASELEEAFFSYLKDY